MGIRRTVVSAPAILIAAFTLGGCYHAVVETGRTANGTVIEDKWADSFVEGLAPPDVIDTAEDCPNGVARVETKHSFLNVLAAALTFGIYTPMHITVHCASAGDADAAGDRTVRAGEGMSVEAAVARAIRLSERSGSAAFVVLPE